MNEQLKNCRWKWRDQRNKNWLKWENQKSLYLHFWNGCWVDCAKRIIVGRNGSAWEASSTRKGRNKRCRHGDWVDRSFPQEERGKQTIPAMPSVVHFQCLVLEAPGWNRDPGVWSREGALQGDKEKLKQHILKERLNLNSTVPQKIEGQGGGLGLQNHHRFSQ